MKYRPKHVCEYVFLRIIVVVLRLMPYRLALLKGWCIAWFSFHVVRFRVSSAKARIREVFGDRFSEREINRIAWISWRNFVFCVVDMIRLSLVTKEWAKKYIVNYEEVMKEAKALLTHCETGKGALLVCPHTGSWEIAGVMMQMLDVPIFFITGRQKNPLVDAYINILRESTGIATVQRGSSLLKSVIRRLKKGGVLAFLPDVRAANEEMRIRFLGKEANVPAGMALFARQSKVPIFTGVVSRIGWSRHCLRTCKPVWPDIEVDKREDWQRMTQEVFESIEQAIREQPEQWFWFNKRWILDPIESVESIITGERTEP